MGQHEQSPGNAVDHKKSYRLFTDKRRQWLSCSSGETLERKLVETLQEILKAANT